MLRLQEYLFQLGDLRVDLAVVALQVSGKGGQVEGQRLVGHDLGRAILFGILVDGLPNLVNPVSWDYLGDLGLLMTKELRKLRLFQPLARDFALAFGEQVMNRG